MRDLVGYQWIFFQFFIAHPRGINMIYPFSNSQYRDYKWFVISRPRAN